MASTRKTIRKLAFRFGIIIVALLFIGWVSYELWLLTIDSVIPNQIYRSAQLPISILQYYVKAKHIKTVINMRGPHPQSKWYQQEVNTMKKLGIKHYDIAMNAYKVPSKERMRKLIYLLIMAPKPILVHCLGGADRSGFACALAIILNGNPLLKESKQQFSLAHFVISKRSVSKLVFPYYIGWLKEHHLKHNRSNFLKWACSKEPFHQKHSHSNSKDLIFYNHLFMNNVCTSSTKITRLMVTRFPKPDVI